MRYILDFDHTLFDTESFITAVESAGRREDLVTEAIWNEFNIWDYVFSDARKFIAGHDQRELHILTAITHSLGSEAERFQRRKLESGGFFDLVSTITFMAGDKGPYVAELAESEPSVFVDDRPSNLRSARRQAPQVLSVQMRRREYAAWLPDLSTEGIAVVQDFDELESLAATV